eukprot:183515-Prymnesium_polylepis.1
MAYLCLFDRAVAPSSVPPQCALPNHTPKTAARAWRPQPVDMPVRARWPTLWPARRVPAMAADA